MKGKAVCTRKEADEIIALIKEKLRADTVKQKGVRAKIGRRGFCAEEDFGLTGGYTEKDFLMVVTIIG